ncbi:MAG TPA: hypothetical protein VNZ64_00325 [Candidatus Acidoferrum sp.]|jgi:hypothetical protein|nr:hypothetical protein [Candidatus Acidoferrum sp.]
MTDRGKTVAWLTGGLLLCQGAWAITDGPYAGIVARNVFALKPAPVAVPIEEVKPPPSKITLTGITTILGRKQALMKTPPPAGKPGEPPKGEQSYILGEGEREGDIEVLQIDEKAGTVKVKNGDVLVVLNFDKDGQKLVSSPLLTAQPGAIPPPAVGGLRPPGVNPYGQPAGGSGFNLPTRPLRAQPGTVNPNSAGYSPGGYSPGGFGGVANPSVSAGGAALPVYGGANSAAQAQAQAQAAAQQPQMTPEEQIIHMEAMRELNKNNPNFPPLPPTSLNPNPTGTAANPEQGTTPTTTPSVPTPPRLPGMPQQLPQ